MTEEPGGIFQTLKKIFIFLGKFIYAPLNSSVSGLYESVVARSR